MKIGIVGLPNKGKSSFFSCLTSVNVPIANYPFTTIDPNSGIGYIVVDCPCKEFKVKCNPKTRCEHGKRFVPVNLVDIAGIVKGAHTGKGLGNYFLDRIRDCDATLQVLDMSGATDLEGNILQDYSGSPWLEPEIFKEEYVIWVLEILKKNARRFKGKGFDELAAVLSGLNMTTLDVEHMLTHLGIDKQSISDDEKNLKRIAEYVYEFRPKAFVANKMDLGKAKENLKKIPSRFKAYPTIAIAELYARKLESQGILKITDSIEVVTPINELDEQTKNKIAVLTKIFTAESEIKLSTEILTNFVLDKMGYVVVYPVEDEKRLSDSKGNILPDAKILKKGSTPIDLAGSIHTELAKNLITAIDVRKGMNVAKDHELKHLDVIKLVVGK